MAYGIKSAGRWRGPGNNYAFSVPPAAEDGFIILEIVFAKPDRLGV